MKVCTNDISKYGYVPFLEGLFHLSPNLGIVTKAGIWLIPKWNSFDWFIYRVETTKEIVTCMKFLQPMVLKGIVGGGFTCANWLADASSCDRYPWNVTGSKKALPESTQRELMERHGTSWWNVYHDVYGASARAQKYFLIPQYSHERAERRHPPGQEPAFGQPIRRYGRLNLPNLVNTTFFLCFLYSVCCLYRNS